LPLPEVFISSNYENRGDDQSFYLQSSGHGALLLLSLLYHRQGRHAGPSFRPRLPFLGHQGCDPELITDARQVRIDLPLPHRLSHLPVVNGCAPLLLAGARGQILLQLAQSLAAPAGLFLAPRPEPHSLHFAYLTSFTNSNQ
jgi:hypothetical protein